MVDRVLEPDALFDSRHIRITGPKVSSPRAVMISMVLHEIATNAAKYGAVSDATRPSPSSGD